LFTTFSLIICCFLNDYRSTTTSSRGRWRRWSEGWRTSRLSGAINPRLQPFEIFFDASQHLDFSICSITHRSSKTLLTPFHPLSATVGLRMRCLCLQRSILFK
jgi:hypothetical protein